MYSFPGLGRPEMALVVSTVVLLAFAYVVYPVHMVQVSTWLLIFTLYLTWMTFFLYRLAFAEE